MSSTATATSNSNSAPECMIIRTNNDAVLNYVQQFLEGKLPSAAASALQPKKSLEERMIEVRAQQPATTKYLSRSTHNVIPEILLPWCGQIRHEWCYAINERERLYVQCHHRRPKNKEYCMACEKRCETNEYPGIPPFGDIRLRDEYVLPAISYAEIMKKKGYTREQVETEAAKFGWTIPERHFGAAAVVTDGAVQEGAVQEGAVQEEPVDPLVSEQEQEEEQSVVASSIPSDPSDPNTITSTTKLTVPEPTEPAPLPAPQKKKSSSAPTKKRTVENDEDALIHLPAAAPANKSTANATVTIEGIPTKKRKSSSSSSSSTESASSSSTVKFASGPDLVKTHKYLEKEPIVSNNEEEEAAKKIPPVKQEKKIASIPTSKKIVA